MTRMISFRDYIQLVEAQDTETGNYVSIDASRPDILDTITVETGKVSKEFHVTLMYSKASKIDPNNVLSAINKEYGKVSTVGKIIGAAAFDSQESDSLACIVLKLYSPILYEIHDFLLDMGLTHSYDDYSPHLTLFYDVDKEEAKRWVAILNKKDLGFVPLSGVKSTTIIEDWNKE